MNIIFLLLNISSLYFIKSSSFMLKCYAAEKNKGPIGEVVQEIIGKQKYKNNHPINVFEIASGTGEHANYFNSIISNLKYQPSDPSLEVQDSILAWTEEFRSHVYPPIVFDILNYQTLQLPSDFVENKVDIVICINMIHISHFDCTKSLFKFASNVLNKQGVLLTYGPYRVNGFMTDSNIAFDESLKARNPNWGVRDIELLQEVALEAGMQLIETKSMPANNLVLLWGKNKTDL